MCTLSLDIDAVGPVSGDPAVVNWVVTRLAGTALTIADIVRSLSMTLNSAVIDPARTVEVPEAFDTARQAFVEACGAAQGLTAAVRNFTERCRCQLAALLISRHPIPEASDLTVDRPSKGHLRRDHVVASPPLTQPIDNTGIAAMGKRYGSSTVVEIEVTALLTTTMTTVTPQATPPT
jgi:hypothetical protein